MAEVIRLNVKRKNLPVIKDTVRPFRLWLPHEGRTMPHRCYSDERRAQDRALSLARWELKVPQSIEVVDVRSGKLLGVYTRRVHFIDFMGGD